MRIKRSDQLDQTEYASGLIAVQSSEDANIDSWLRILGALKDKSRQKKRIASRAPVSQRIGAQNIGFAYQLEQGQEQISQRRRRGLEDGMGLTQEESVKDRS
jgi:hypothetical protein